MKVFVDLCAGLGGASQAFMDDPDWLVIRIDNNAELKPLCPGLNVADVTDSDVTLELIEAVCLMHGVELHNCDKLVVWASPPCDEFSLAYNAKQPTAARNGEDYDPDMSIMLACLYIIRKLLPDHWYIENVRGAISWFTPYLGSYRQQLASFFVWGDHPIVDFYDANLRKLRKVDIRHSDLRAQHRAKVHFEISQAIKDSIDKQMTLTSYGVGVEPGA